MKVTIACLGQTVVVEYKIDAGFGEGGFNSGTFGA